MTTPPLHDSELKGRSDSVKLQPTPHATSPEEISISERTSLQMQADFHLHRHSLQLAREDKLRTSGVVIEMKDTASKDTLPGTTSIQKELDIDYHEVKLQDLLNKLDTDAERGLSSEFAQHRLKLYGLNEISHKNRFRWVTKIFSYLFGGFGVILWPAAVLCLLSYQPIGALQGGTPQIQNLLLSLVLFLVIFVNAGFEAWQDWQSLKVMNSIGKMLPATCRVLRDGAPTEVRLNTLVVGDIVLLENGNRVPADLRLIQNQQLKVDNSILTGETEPISCTIECTNAIYVESKNILFMGTSIVEGTGTGVVVSKGNDTMMGKISKMANAAAKTTPIRKEIRAFMIIITTLALITGLTVLLSWVFWLRVDYPGFMTPAYMVVTVIGVVVAFIPEGLPICVSLTFTVMAKRMQAQNVLVKSLPTVETLGSVDIIASDKTGTLTQNSMSVAHVFCGMRTYEMGDQTRRLFESSHSAFSEILRVAALCNRASFEDHTLHLPIQQRQVHGDASDRGILLFAEEFKNVSTVRSSYKKLTEIPFNSKVCYNYKY